MYAYCLSRSSGRKLTSRRSHSLVSLSPNPRRPEAVCRSAVATLRRYLRQIEESGGESLAARDVLDGTRRRRALPAPGRQHPLTSSCSQTRTDRHPSAARRRSVSRSRSTLRLSFWAHQVGVVDRLRRMLRAAVPEAPVDEHGDLGTREQDVRSSARHPGERGIDAEPAASGVEKPAERDLRLRVTSALPAHPCARPTGFRVAGMTTSCHRPVCRVKMRRTAG